MSHWTLSWGQSIRCSWFIRCVVYTTWDTLILWTLVYIIQINHFQGDLSNVSAKIVNTVCHTSRSVKRTPWKLAMLAVKAHVSGSNHSIRTLHLHLKDSSLMCHLSYSAIRRTACTASSMHSDHWLQHFHVCCLWLGVSHAACRFWFERRTVASAHGRPLHRDFWNQGCQGTLLLTFVDACTPVILFSRWNYHVFWILWSQNILFLSYTCTIVRVT